MTSFNEQATAYENMMESQRSRQDEDMDDERDEEGLAEIEPDYEAITERRAGRRHPGDYYGWPSDEQMEYFKRGGR